jgi:hypothetical protein
VLVYQEQIDGGDISGAISIFSRYPEDPYGGYSCTTVPSTGCNFEVCTNSSDAGAVASGFARTGDLTLSAAGHQWVLPEDDAGFVYGSTPGYTFLGGETVTATAPGFDVPGFTAEVTMPSLVSLTSTLPQTVNRSTPLLLTWQGSSPDTLVYISSAQMLVACRASSISQLTVPASVLQQLPAGSGVVEVLTWKNSVTYAGQWPVNLIAYQFGSSAYQSVTFQ